MQTVGGRTGAAVDWQSAGTAWGDRALDWAYLFEAYARPANDRLFDELGVGPGERVLDVACGSGYAAWVATQRGALVSGLDASENLIRIARARNPEADLRIGDMFALPFEDGQFDVVTSFNGIWAGCDAAVVEARRVLRSGGRFGMTFWGAPKRLGLLPYFATVAALSPPSHTEATLTQGGTGRPGLAEAMLRDAGLRVDARGVVTVWAEWPDLDTAVRAMTAAGPSWPALAHVGPETFGAELRKALTPSLVDGIGIRLPNEFGYLTATRI
jgi:SAM-dependent methyltransferase